MEEGDEKAPALASCWGLDGLTSLEGWTETAWKLEAVAKLRVSPHLIKKYRCLFVNKEDIQWPSSLSATLTILMLLGIGQIYVQLLTMASMTRMRIGKSREENTRCFLGDEKQSPPVQCHTLML